MPKTLVNVPRYTPTSVPTYSVGIPFTRFAGSTRIVSAGTFGKPEAPRLEVRPCQVTPESLLRYTWPMVGTAPIPAAESLKSAIVTQMRPRLAGSTPLGLIARLPHGPTAAGVHAVLSVAVSISMQ